MARCNHRIAEGMCRGLAVLSLTVCVTAIAAPQSSFDVEAFSRKVEAGYLGKLDEASLRRLLAESPPSALIDAALRILQRHPEYVATLTKVERVRGRLPNEPDVIALKFRREPMAVYGEWIAGPHKGRRALYNSAIDSKQILVREGGWLGLVSVHIALDNPITRRDTNHAITEMGIEYVLRKTRADLEHLLSQGKTIDISKGRWYQEKGKHYFDLVNETSGPPEFYACWARLKFDLDTGMLEEVEIRDAQGNVLEQFSYRDVKWVDLPDDTFDEDNPAFGF